MPGSAVLGDRLDDLQNVGGLPVLAVSRCLPRFADDLAGFAVALAAGCGCGRFHGVRSPLGLALPSTPGRVSPKKAATHTVQHHLARLAASLHE